MEFERVIEKRASIRHYSQKKFDIVNIIELIETANHSPTPGNLSIMKYVIVENPDTIAKIADACQQPFIADAPYLIVACSNPKDSEIMYGERAGRYVTQTAGASIMSILLKVTDMGLASCWIGAFSDSIVKRLLQIPDKVNVEAILPIAYPANTDKTLQKRKHDIQNKSIWYETWKNKFKLSPARIRREDV